MFKYIALIVAFLAVAFANPEAKPAVVASYSAYGTPLAYSAPVYSTYAAAPVVSAGYHAPLAYSAGYYGAGRVYY